MNQQAIASPAATAADRKAKVFVSYSRKDMAFAHGLVARGLDDFPRQGRYRAGEPRK